MSRLLEWPRRLAGVAALLPFVAAGTLVVGPAGTSRRVVWAILAAVGVAIAGIFAVAFARPETAADRPRPDGRRRGASGPATPPVRTSPSRMLVAMSPSSRSSIVRRRTSGVTVLPSAEGRRRDPIRGGRRTAHRTDRLLGRLVARKRSSGRS